MGLSVKEIEYLKGGIDKALGGGRLDAWQTKFLTDMRRRIARYGTKTRLSEKQANKLYQIIGHEREPIRTKSPWASMARLRRTPSWQRRPKSFLAREARWWRRRIARDVITFAAVVGVMAILSLVWSRPFPSLVRSTPLPIVSTGPSASVITKDQFTVTDGDTIRMNGASKGTRLVGFNTPETFDPECSREKELGDRATARLKELVASAELELLKIPCACEPGTEGTDECNYGRSCGTLRADGRDVGKILISEGLAVPFVCGATSCPPTPRPWCD